VYHLDKGFISGLKETITIGIHRLLTVTYSPNGEYYAIGDSNREVHVFVVATSTVRAIYNWLDKFKPNMLILQ
jgi:hypothetical protein